jgi:hypothetical protein
LWGALALGGMLAGNRFGHCSAWFAGAVHLARDVAGGPGRHRHRCLRILSFPAVGARMLLIGFDSCPNRVLQQVQQCSTKLIPSFLASGKCRPEPPQRSRILPAFVISI